MLPLAFLAVPAVVALPAWANALRRRRSARRRAQHDASPASPPPVNQEATPPPSEPAAPPAPPYAKPAPPRVPAKPPELPDTVTTASEVAAGAKLVTSIAAASPLAPVAPLFGAIGNLVAGWAAEKDRADKAQPYLKATMRLALEWAYFNATMEGWPEGDRLYEAGAYAGAADAYEAARAKGREARLAMARHLDRLNVEGYRKWMQAKENAPGFLDGVGDGDAWDAVLYRGWKQGLAGITGLPHHLVQTVDKREQEGRWRYTSAVDGRCRVYHWRQGHAQYDGEVVEERQIDPVAEARWRQALEVRAQRPEMEEQRGVSVGEDIRDRKDRARRGELDDPEAMGDMGDTRRAPRSPAPIFRQPSDVDRLPEPVPKPAPAPAPAPAPEASPRPVEKQPMPRPVFAIDLSDGPPKGKGWDEAVFTENE